MKDIDSHTCQVLVWLGPERHDSDLALDTLRHLKSQVFVNHEGNLKVNMVREADPSFVDPSIALPYRLSRRTAVDALLSRPWLSRLWTWQEVRLAKRAAIYCGHTSLERDSFQDALACILAKLNRAPDKDVPKLYSRVNNAVSINQSLTDHDSYLWMKKVDWSKLHVKKSPIPHMSFFDAMRVTSKAKCSDPRNRIYAILSIIRSEGVSAVLKVDYTLHFMMVYRKPVLLSLYNELDLNLLTVCHLSGAVHGWPTWIPNWSMKRLFDVPTIRGAGQDSRARGELRENYVLYLTGLYPARIAKIVDIGASSGTSTASRSYAALVTGIQELVHQASIEGHLKTSQILDIVTHTLFQHRLSEMYVGGNPDYLSFHAAKGLVGDLVSTSTPFTEKRVTAGWTRKERACFSLMPDALSHLSFFLTKKGDIGLAPDI